MRLVREPPRAGSDALGALFGAAIAAGAALATAWFRFGLPVPVCRFRDWAGLPCATCGSTRVIDALLHGRILEAASWNPLVFCGLISLSCWAALSVTRLVFGVPARRLIVGRCERRASGLLFVVAAAANWVYVIWRGV